MVIKNNGREISCTFEVKTWDMFRRFTNAFIFSNSFYGLAAIALALENNLLLGLPPNHLFFYLVLASGTIAFYTYSYQYDPHPLPGNQRARWIRKNRAGLWLYRNLMGITTLVFSTLYLLQLPRLPDYQWMVYLLLLSIFPVMGVLYYGVGFPGVFHFRLRRFARFKPFIIGMVWAGCTNFMPWILSAWESEAPINLRHHALFFWLHNWMFISVLCILFDMKDYVADHNRSFKTLVVRIGMRAVIFRIVGPLLLTGMIALAIFFLVAQIPLPAAFFLFAPLLLVLLLLRGFRKRRAVFYYLVIIDGMMVVKALLGILASVWI